MTSKNLFFKLMKEDFKRRLWAVALIGLACFFLYPVAAAFMAGSIRENSVYAQGLKVYTRDMLNLMSFSNGGAVFGMMVASLICGLSSFSYLNSKSKVDFYHGIPVRREMLYGANYLNGILIVAVPYVVSVVLAVIIGVANGISNEMLAPAALEACGLNLVYYILMYSTVVIAAMLTGNVVVGFLGSVVFNVVVPLTVSMIHGYFTLFFATYCSYIEHPFYRWGVRISPLMEYITQVARYSEDGASMIPAAAAALLISLVLALLGCFLYRKRPSEAAGKAMAFAVSRPINRIVLTLLSATGLGAFFWGLRNSTGWAVFGLICGAVICHCVVEIIYNFDFKKLFSNKLQLLGCILVSLAVLMVFRYDLFGYDTYLPKETQVESAAVDVRRMDNWVTYGGLCQDADGYYWEGADSSSHICETMEYRDVENLLLIAREGVRQVEEKKTFSRTRSGEQEVQDAAASESGKWSDLIIRYRMKNGRSIYRKYSLCVDDILPQMERLMADGAFQKGMYPVMNRQQDQVAAIRYREGDQEVVLDELPMEEKNALLAAYQEEFGAMTMARMYEEVPLGLIRFTSSSEEVAMKWLKEQERLAAGNGDVSGYSYEQRRRYWGYGSLTTRDYYPVYPSFEKTLELLGRGDVRAGEYVREWEVQSITIHKYSTGQGDDYRNVIITEPEQIAELAEVLQDYDRMYYNPFFRQEPNLDVTVSYIQDGESYSTSAVFPQGKVPRLVWERLEEAKQ